VAVPSDSRSEPLYGTTNAGGTYDNGTIYKITPNSTLTTVHSFNGTDGATFAGLVQANKGYILGSTQDGGTNYCPNGMRQAHACRRKLQIRCRLYAPRCAFRLGVLLGERPGTT
jgi:uncharacterized repeat protein (TIGR03803 family)